MDVGEFTLKEVAEHGNASSCWIVIHRKVYDVTSFLKEVCLTLKSKFIDIDFNF